MKKWMLLLAMCFVLSGCGGSGITQEEYDAVVSEKDDLKSDYDTLKKVYEAKLKLTEWEIQVNNDYEWLMFLLDFSERMGSNVVDTKLSTIDIKSKVDVSFSVLRSTIDQFISNNDMDLAKEFDFDGAIEEINKVMESWNGMIEAVHSSL